MRWEKIPIPANHGEGGLVPVSCGPGKRWGHTCNSIRGGKLLYVFGGYGKDNCQTNQVHVFDTVTRTWSEPLIKGTPPVPRDSHSCTTVGDNLFIYGGTDGNSPLNDLHILDTSSNTWISPNVRGEGPEAREGHSAAVIGKRIFIFGGCGKASNSSVEEYYDDVYILNTETFVWKHAATTGTPPAKRDSHTCSSWRNKIIVIGGEDSCNYYLSDVHILDTDTLIWGKLNTSGQLLPPRAGHTTVALGKNLFIFGGFTDEQSLYDDIFMFDVDTGLWTKVITTGDGPSARFSMAGDSLDPQQGGVLVFLGGCNKNLEALDDMYYLFTGLAKEPERDERRLEKLSLRKQLKLKCQEQHAPSQVYDKALSGVETNVHAYQPMPVANHIQPSRQNIYLHEYQTPPGKRTFQAKVTKSFPDGYTIETLIDGKPLRGVLFSNKRSFNTASDDDYIKKTGSVEVGAAKPNDDHNSNSEAARSLEQDVMDDRLADGVLDKKSVSPDHQLQAAAASDLENLMTSDASQPHEVAGDFRSSVVPNVNLEATEASNTPYYGTEVIKDKTPAATSCLTLPPGEDARALTAEENRPFIENPPVKAI